MLDGLKRSGALAPLHLRILATSDLHSHLLPFDYISDQAAEGQGLACLAVEIERLRAERPNCLLLDNGDTLEGSPLADLAIARRAGPHPMITAMNALEYDAAVPGNHDFNFGLDVLDAAVADAQFPFSLANVTRKDGQAYLVPSLVLERDWTDEHGNIHRLNIGIVGLTPPQIMEWDGLLLKDHLQAEPMISAAEREMTRLRHTEKVDLVVALCHSGIAIDGGDEQGENVVLPVAAMGLADVIIAGHTHAEFPGRDIYQSPVVDAQMGLVADTPVVQPAPFGRSLGVVDLSLIPKPGGGWHLDSAAACTTPAKPGPARPDMQQLCSQAHAYTRDLLDEVIGDVTAPVTGYFDLFHFWSVLSLTLDAKRAAATRLLQSANAKPLPLLAAAAPTRTGGFDGTESYTEIAAGPVRMRHVFDLCSFANRLAVLRVSGAGLRRWLEHSARAFHEITLDPDATSTAGQKLINHTIPGYNFDVIDGVKYEIDVTQTALEPGQSGPGRIRNLTYNGRAVVPEDMFHLVTNSYRAGNGGGFCTVSGAEPVLISDLLIRDALADHIRERKTLTPRPLSNWRFSDAGGTVVIAETGAKAARYADAMARLGAAYIGQSPDGIAQFCLKL